MEVLRKEVSVISREEFEVIESGDVKEGGGWCDGEWRY